MSDFTDRVADFLSRKTEGEVVKKVYFTEDHMNTKLFIEFESGRNLEIEYDWIYKFAYNGEEIDHE